MIHCYPGYKRKARTICEAFAKGCNGKVMKANAVYAGGPAMVYGVSPYTLSVVIACHKAGEDVYIADNGYLRRDQYYRVTKNGWQVTEPGKGDFTRLKNLNISISDWEPGGVHVLLCPPGEKYANIMGFSAVTWYRDTVRRIREYTDRQIVLRVKPDHKAIEHNYGPLPRLPHNRHLHTDLINCKAVVVYNSNVAVDALLEGVPVVTLAECAASPLSTPIEQINTPVYSPEREAFAAHLAANQWNIEEIVNGTCWNALSNCA